MDINFRKGFEKVAVGTRFVDEAGNRITHEGMARLGIKAQMAKAQIFTPNPSLSKKVGRQTNNFKRS